MAHVFVSSTYMDLKECREKVRLVLKQMGHEDIAMEYYLADTKKPLDKCLEDVASCDLYLGIFAWRYGYIPDGYDKSITELEYRKAVDTGKDCLIFLQNESANWPPKFVDKGEDFGKISELRNELSGKHICGYFNSASDLAKSVREAVYRWEKSYFVKDYPNQFNENYPNQFNEKRYISKYIKRKVDEEAIRKNTINDRYVDDQKNDALDFWIYVTALRDFITSSETETPLSIGIDGSWGSGKTSLMQMLMKELDPKKSFFESCREFLITILWSIKFLIGKLSFLLIKVLSRTISKFDYVATKFKKYSDDLLYIKLYDPSINSTGTSKTNFNITRQIAKICSWRYRRDPTTHFSVWFNAWRYDHEEQLWAAVALSVIDEIKKRYNPLHLFAFWVRLSIKRFSLKGFLGFLAKVLLISFVILAGIFVWLYGLSSSGTISLYNISMYNYTLPSLSPILNKSSDLWYYVIYIGGFVSLFFVSLTIYEQFKNLFRFPVTTILEKPNYEDKMGFIKNFNADFSNIVLAATKPLLPGYKSRKLIIFIDDLDRCKPSKVADIIEAVNLFLDSKGCIFIIGMDSKVVTACIETRYKGVTTETKSAFKGFEYPGKLFLDKIIQLTLHVPKATKEDIDKLVNKVIEPKSNIDILKYQVSKNVDNHTNGGKNISPPNLIKSQSPAFISYSNEDVIDAIKLGSHLLNGNPRQVKKFINTFRLYAYIVNNRGLFEERSFENQNVGINLERLAVWVAFSLRWGEISDYMLSDSNINSLRLHLKELSTLLLKQSNYSLPSDEYDKLTNIIKNKRKLEGKSAYHWCNFPWEIWYSEPDFMKAINILECFWSEPLINEPDWLYIVLKMTSVIGNK